MRSAIGLAVQLEVAAILKKWQTWIHVSVPCDWAVRNRWYESSQGDWRESWWTPLQVEGHVWCLCLPGTWCGQIVPPITHFMEGPIYSCHFLLSHHITFMLLVSYAPWSHLPGLPAMIAKHECLRLPWGVDFRFNSIKGRSLGLGKWKDAMGFASWGFMMPFVSSTRWNVWGW